jgi:hypothetical protein
VEDLEVVEFIAFLFAEGFLDFPWKKYFIKDPRDLFQSLQTYKPTMCTKERTHFKGRLRSDPFLSIRTFDGKPRTVLVSDMEYDTMDIIVDYFQEKCRLSARRQDQDKCPLDKWKDIKIVTQALKAVIRKELPINTYQLREILYTDTSLGIKECTQFKPSFVVAVCREIGNVTRVLDFSAGWGDRLVGFLAAGVQRYVAYDPNIGLKEGHDAILATLPSKTNVTIEYLPFEDAQLPVGETFDMIFTSPPFFTFEFYEGQNTSTDRYREFNQWAVDFLFVALHKSWSVLDVGGHFCIYIQDSRGINITEPMCLFMIAALPGASHRGVIYSLQEEGSCQPRPLWVFRREQSNDPQRRETAFNLLRQHFNGLFNRINQHPVLKHAIQRARDDGDDTGERDPKRRRTEQP